MFESFKTIDQNLLLSINAWHNPVLDGIMFYVSQTWYFAPLFIFWLILICKKVAIKQVLILFLFLGLLITLTDQTSNIAKHSFKRYRPTHHTVVGTKLHTVNNYRGGKYGFFSGHAANSFGIAMLLSLMFKSRSVIFKFQFFLWAAITAYSRVYLGVHYPSDIIVGSAVGIMWGFVVYHLILFTFKKYNYEAITV